MLLHSIINFVCKQVSWVKSSFDQLTKRTGLTGVLVGLRSRTYRSMTNTLVQSCHSTLSSNPIIYQRRLNKIMRASTHANLDGKFKVDLALRTPHHCSECSWNASRNDWIKLPFLLRAQAITEMRTLSCHPAKHFTCLFSRHSGYLSISSKILTQNDKTTKRHYDKRKYRNHSSIGCEHENFLLAAESLSGLWGHVRNFMFA